LKITLLDRQTYAISQRETTPEGYLKAPARVARTGIQQYLARELNLDGDPNRLVNVYRPPEEVFSADSLASYNAADLSDDHPNRLIDPDNYTMVTRGVVASPGVQDGDFVKATVIIKDKEAIKKVASGKAQLSVGYTAEYDPTPGKTTDGQEYEFVQRDIVVNHVALVDVARAGPQARIFDHNHGGRKMAQVTLDNGRSVELEDASAALVEDCIKRLTDDAANHKATADGLQAKVDGLTTDLDKIKQESSDDAIAAKVKLVSDTMAAAKKIAGAEFTCDSLNPAEIRLAALMAKDPARDLTGKSDAYIEAAFDMAAEKEEEEEDGKKAAQDSLAQIAADMAAGASGGGDKPTAKQTYDANISDGWKKTAGEDA
jgi:hypothetical protein